MSFGFSAGDFFAAAQLAHKMRKDFSGAPGQFKSLSDETKLLSMVLQDADVTLEESDLTAQQGAKLEQAMSTCEAVLRDLQAVCDEFSDLDTTQGRPRKSIRRVWKKLKWEPEEARELRDRVSSTIAMLTAVLGQASSETRVTVKKGVERLNQGQDRRERLAILNWLSSFDHATQQNGATARRQAGTGVWFLESPEFVFWKSTRGETLFCPGIPGAGKTILSSMVVEELTKQFEDDSDVCVAYVYLDYQQHDNQAVDQVFASLLRQLVADQSVTPAVVHSLYRKHSTKGSKLKFAEISKLLKDFCQIYSRVFIIIDALDECPSRDGRRNDLLKELFDHQAALSANLMCTSRPIPEIEARFNGALFIKIHASEHDVREYLDGQLGRLPRFVARSPELREQVKKQIVEVVDGMFLLAHLHLESLMYKPTPKALRKALEELPRGSSAYDSTYEKTMKRIESQFLDQAELAKNVLRWIVCAKAPLSTLELQHALAVEIGEENLDFDNLPDAEDMVTACGGLVTADQEGGLVRLVHYTTQEYFERTRNTWFPGAEDHLAEVCLTYISFRPFRRRLCKTWDEYQVRLRDWPFYQYTCRHWGFHARQTPSVRILSFFGLKRAFWSSLQPLFENQTISMCRGYQVDLIKEHITPLHVASHFGLASVVGELIVRKPVDQQTAWGSTALNLAAAQGHDAVARLLLEHGATVNIQDAEGKTPLHRAAEGHHDEVCKTLLRTGRVNINLRDLTGRSPLSHAIEVNSTSIVDMMLQIDDVHIGSNEKDDSLALSATRYSSRRSPLLCAVTRGKEEIVERLVATNQASPTPSLLNHGINFDRPGVTVILMRSPSFETNADLDGEGTLLSYAAQRGCIEVVEALLRRPDVKVNLKGRCQRTPLSYAAQGGHVKVVKALLQAPNIDVDSSVWGYSSRGKLAARTPLSFAAERGHHQVVKMLLDTGQVDPDSRGDSYRYPTPLTWTILSAVRDVVKDCRKSEEFEAVLALLLGTGQIDVNSRADLHDWDDVQGGGGMTPLLIATSGRVSPRLVKLLLENGADANAVSHDGTTPLSNAHRCRQWEVADLLVEYGAKPLEDPRQTGQQLRRRKASGALNNLYE